MAYKNKKPEEKLIAGRPKKEINQKQFEEMCHIQCTEQEICNILGVGTDKLCQWCEETYGATFSEVYKKYSFGGKMSLRRAQMRIAQDNATMAIWLGKQMLGQRDNIDARITGAEDDELTVAIKEAIGNGK